MRSLAAFLALALPITPFMYYLYFSSFPAGLIKGLSAATLLIGSLSLIRRKRLGAAGMFSAFTSSTLAMFGSGYLPALVHLQIGTFSPAWQWLLGLTISLSLLGQFMGNVYDTASRLSSTLRRSAYERSDVRELNKLVLWSAGASSGILAVSFVTFEAMSSLRVFFLSNALLALLVFVTVYGLFILVIRNKFGGEK
ncbi:MAG: hypothetical protein ACP5LS_05230 [Thermoprotei archaeon]